MKALCFQVRTLQPVLVTRLGAGEENSSQSYNYIPGSVLRGAAIDLFSKHYPGVRVNRDPLGERLFFSGCYFLNAYPSANGNSRFLPKPLSLRVPKVESSAKDKVFDFAVSTRNDVDQPQLPSGDFVNIDGAKITFLKARMFSQIHNASSQRFVKKRDYSQVFRYESLAPGEVFGGVILGETDLLIKLQNLLEDQEVSLGGARSAGYGKSILENFQIDLDWNETASKQGGNGQFIITLLSPAIIRDEFGQPTFTLDGVVGQTHLAAFTKVEITGGFNRYWGLPLPQSTALAAGSVFVYPKDLVEEAHIKKIVEDGIGERRIEGFGRVALNWNVHPELIKNELTPFVKEEVQQDTPIKINSENRLLAQRMATRWLRAKLDNRLSEALANLAIVSPPENSQLSQLRQAAHQALKDGDFKSITEYIDNLKSPSEQFYRARVIKKPHPLDDLDKDKNEKGTRLYIWLKEGLGENDAIWNELLRPTELPSVGDVEADETNLRIEYVVRLLDGLFKKTIREKRAKGSG